MMKKFMNNADDFLEESLKGLFHAHAGLLEVHFDPIFVNRKSLNPDKVLLVSGGGSGHEPLHIYIPHPRPNDVGC